MSKNRPFTDKLRFALAGWRHAWRSEVNFRRQVWIGGAAVLVVIAVRAPLVWLALTVLCIGMVWALELANTAVEELVDLVSPERRVVAGKIKDLMAGAVLFAALASLVVGVCALWVALG
ncbi:diacylglycerol kinase [Acidihalobacter ferrooxydans]|uniref:Diacylglycerol kinase n=1 Tax=Acidihalobacter ferrooxydans TaxID=1765967 RepID=A0A1P8UDH8_9GAMM|nr:diacylglycerol kinase [Acidihalobacter ferrooxydans]APZ41890.1 hypothetical protein BW247_01235 [Acidihalobacter ferrooxydans]